MSIKLPRNNDYLFEEIKNIKNNLQMSLFIERNNDYFCSYMQRKKFIFQLYQNDLFSCFFLFIENEKIQRECLFVFRKIFVQNENKYIDKILQNEKFIAIIKASEDDVLINKYKQNLIKNNIGNF